jgi:hypothetical protein
MRRAPLSACRLLELLRSRSCGIRLRRSLLRLSQHRDRFSEADEAVQKVVRRLALGG